MRRSSFNTTNFDYFQSLADCVHFLNGVCRFGRTCRYRHFPQVKRQLTVCVHWPDRCRKIECRFRHPALPIKQTAYALQSSLRGSAVGFFWNMEKIPIPEGQNASDIIRRLRQKLVIERSLQEVEFSCYCDIDTISEENQQSLRHAMVTLVHVSDQQTNAANQQIMFHLDRFERAYPPPATVVLVSDDIDFVDRLRALLHHIIIVRNKLVKMDLKATINECFSWTLFTREQTGSLMRRLFSNNSRSLFNSNENTPTGSTTPVHRRNYPRIKSVPSSSSDSDQSTSPNDHHNRNGFAQKNGHSYHVIQYKNDYSNSTERREKDHREECAFCDAQFETPEELHQHQANRSHLYGCSVCNRRFFTYEDQVQHRIDKGHYPNQDSSTSEDELSSIDRTKH